VFHLGRRLCRLREVELMRTVGRLVFFGCCRACRSPQGLQEPRGQRVLGEPMDVRHLHLVRLSGAIAVSRGVDTSPPTVEPPRWLQDRSIASDVPQSPQPTSGHAPPPTPRPSTTQIHSTSPPPPRTP